MENRNYQVFEYLNIDIDSDIKLLLNSKFSLTQRKQYLYARKCLY